MKTKKAMNQKGSSTVPKEVMQYEREARKFRAAWQIVNKLQESEAVTAYLKAKEEAANPVQAEQEQKQSELFDLYDKYSMNLKKAQNKLWILSELSFGPHDCDITLGHLHDTIIEIDEHVRAAEEKAERAFEMLGVGKTDPESKEEKAA